MTSIFFGFLSGLLKILRLPIDFVLFSFHWLKGMGWLFLFKISEMFDLPMERRWPFGCLTQLTKNGKSACLPAKKYGTPSIFGTLCPDLGKDEKGCHFCLRSMATTSDRWNPRWGKLVSSSLALLVFWSIGGVVVLLQSTNFEPKVQFGRLLKKNNILSATHLSKKIFSNSPSEDYELAKEFFDKAEIAFKKEKYQEAQLEFRNAIKNNPHYWLYPLRFGECLLHLNRYKEASEAFKSALKLNQDLWQAHLHLSKLSVALGEVETAIEHASKLCELKRDLPDAYVILGTCYFEQGKTDLATDSLTSVKRLEIQDAKTCVDAGYLSLKLQDAPSAEYYFNLGSELDPTLIAPLLGKASLFQKKGEFNQADEQLNKALKIDPDSAFTRSALAELKVLTGSVPEAIDLYREITLSNASDLKHQIRLAQLFIEIGDSNQALMELENLLANHPDNPEVHFLLARIYFSKGLYSSAVKHLRIKLREDRNHPNSLRFLALSYAFLGNHDEAILMAKRYLTVDSENLTIKLLIVQCYRNLGQSEKALSFSSSCADQHPESPFPWIAIGQIHRQNGNSSLAIKNFRQALKVDPEDPLAAKNLLLLLLDQDEEIEEASTLAKDLVHRFPTDPVIINSYGLALYKNSEYLLAYKLFQQSISLNSRIPVSYFLLGKTLIKLDKLTEAKEVLSKSINLSSK